ncbi:hypothetical protein PTKIN_Ptkin02bG0135500 [Pterospermum kingtungense]
MSVFIHSEANSISLSSMTSSSSLDYQPLLGATSFILMNRVWSDNDDTKKEDFRVVTIGPSVGSIVRPTGAHTSGFGAFPVKFDFGQYGASCLHLHRRWLVINRLLLHPSFRNSKPWEKHWS